MKRMKREKKSGKRYSSGIWTGGWSRFRKKPIAVAGAVIVLLLYLTALFAPVLTPYDPGEHGDIPGDRYLRPSAEHPLGTDKFGRDVMTRMFYGSQVSLSIGFFAVALSVLFGSFIGALSGYAGGVVDAVIMRIVDAFMAIPRLFLLLTCIALFSRSILLVIILLGATGWMSAARLVRGQILSIKKRDYITAAEALGMDGKRIIFKHLIPNTLTVIIVSATLRIGGIILTEAALSFLGLGVPPPTPSWGMMVFEGRSVMLDAWWISTFPGLAIVITVIGFNLLGDGLRDAFDPMHFT
ncbi:MAG: ABC transporter permease [Candidatus Krumholzibacteriota bacterium]|nr:ABC transporter permease [Candidatus Krumholzibacteriota bacterium]